jgi:dihydroorotate dehydrogenase (fumarate)
LNLYTVEADPRRSSQQVEESYCELIRLVKSSVRVPVAVKLSPFFSAIPHMAQLLDKVQADGLVLFNRFYQPDFDIDTLEVVPRLQLSQPNELLLRLHWTAILYGHVRASLAITGGVHGADDVLKSIMAGANVAMMTSALLENGVRHATRVLEELSRWMEEHEYESVQQMLGSMSHQAVPNPQALERGNYMRVLSSYTLRPRFWSC